MRPFPAVAVLVACTAWGAAAVAPLPFKAPAQLPDLAQCPVPDQVRLQGFLGQRVLSNEQGRLLVVNEDELLGGFRQRPGSQDWIGEHVGKFLHAATLAWVNTGDPRQEAGDSGGHEEGHHHRRPPRRVRKADHHPQAAAGRGGR